MRVSSEPGPALVIAGAGSGKTRTLTYRVAWLLDHGKMCIRDSVSNARLTQLGERLTFYPGLPDFFDAFPSMTLSSLHTDLGINLSLIHI